MTPYDDHDLPTTGKSLIHLWLNFILLSFRSLLLLAHEYLRHLPTKSSCGGGVQTELDGGWRLGDAQSAQLELDLGVSCCPAPEETNLIQIWNRHKKSVFGLLGSLQGIHLIVKNTNDEIKVQQTTATAEKAVILCPMKRSCPWNQKMNFAQFPLKRSFFRIFCPL